MRYAVFTSFYIDAQTDEEAIYKAKYLAARQEKKNDDQCSVDSIYKGTTDIVRPQVYPVKAIKK